MGIFFISMNDILIKGAIDALVSVPYGDLFYFYLSLSNLLLIILDLVSVPYGDLFYFYKQRKVLND